MRWTELLTLLVQQVPGIERGLRPPPSAQVVASLEAVVQRPLPEEVREILQHHDGQELGGRVLFGLVLMRVDAILKYVRTQPVDPLPVVSDPRFNRPSILPLFTDDTGNYLGVELRPGQEEARAVVFGADLEEISVVAPSLSALFTQLASHLQHGQVERREEAGIPGLRLTHSAGTPLAELLP